MRSAGFVRCQLRAQAGHEQLESGPELLLLIGLDLAAGTGAALGDTFQEIGGAVGVALLGSVFNAIYRADLPSVSPAAARSSLQGALDLHDAALASAARVRVRRPGHVVWGRVARIR